MAPQDMKKVCSLSLIELTALYDVLGLEFKQQKAVKIKTRGKVRVASQVAKMDLSLVCYSLWSNGTQTK